MIWRSDPLTQKTMTTNADPINKFQTTLLITFTTLALLSFNASSSPPFKKIYAFGDSYTDTGNTETSTGPVAFNHVSDPPYGMTFFHHPTNRYSDGRIVLDFLAETLDLPFIPPYRNPNADRSYGVNFAVAGATAIRQGFFNKNNVTLNLVKQSSLQTQLVWLNKVLKSDQAGHCIDMETTPKECDMVFGDALIWLGEIGANDYASTLGSSLSSRFIQALALKSVDGFLQVLLNKGAKYIIVQGLPASGCTTYSFLLSSPEDRDNMGCVATLNQQVRTHNAALRLNLETLRKKNPDATILYADYYKAHLTLFNNPTKYGIKERFKVCCGFGGGEYNFDVFNTCGSPSSSPCSDPSEYINWDGAHFTEAVHKVMTEGFVMGSFCEPSFSYLMKKKLSK